MRQPVPAKALTRRALLRAGGVGAAGLVRPRLLAGTGPELGLEALPRLRKAILDGLERGWHIGAQIYVSLDGRAVCSDAIGRARLDGTPMTPDTLMVWYSATKPVTAACVGLLWERSRLRLDDPVAKYIPAFARKGKHAVTIKHLLTHTGGFPRADLAYRLQLSFDEVTARLCDADLEWTPGKYSRYHPTSGWHMLGAVIAAIDGRSYSRFVREEILLRAGMRDSWVGMPPERFREYGPRIGQMVDVDESGDVAPASMPGGTMTEQQWCERALPGGNGRGPMTELGLFYENLMQDGGLLQRRTVAEMTTPQRVNVVNFDTNRTDAPWGLGFKIQYGLGGAHASRRTFGHAGSASSQAFCDPDRRLVVALVFNGRTARHNRERFLASTNAIYEDLGLA